MLEATAFVHVRRSAELGVLATGAQYHLDVAQQRLAIAEQSVTLDAAALRKATTRVRQHICMLRTSKGCGAQH